MQFFKIIYVGNLQQNEYFTKMFNILHEKKRPM